AVPRPKTSNEPAQDVRFMTYEEFMAARSSRRGKGGRSDSTVAGTHFDSVRALLNRLSGAEPTPHGSAGTDTSDDWMDLGDETADLEEKVREQPVEDLEIRERPAPDMAAYDR